MWLKAEQKTTGFILKAPIYASKRRKEIERLGAKE